MLFNFLLDNHNNPKVDASLNTMLRYFRSVLTLCGHEVTISQFDVFPNAINLWFEFFTDGPRRAQGLAAFKAQHPNLRFGIIHTELFLNGTIPYAQAGIPNNSEQMLQQRLQGLRDLLPVMDFNWVLLERTLKVTEGYPSWLFPMGSLGATPPALCRAPKDIDVLLYGSATPHRLKVVQHLQQAGLKTYTVGSKWPQGFRAETTLHSLIDRAKLCLNLCLNEEPAISAPETDPRFASCIRLTELLTRNACVVSEDIPYDNPYAPYIHQAPVAQLPALCQYLLKDNRWQQEGPTKAAAFHKQMHAPTLCQPIINETLARLYPAQQAA